MYFLEIFFVSFPILSLSRFIMFTIDDEENENKKKNKTEQKIWLTFSKFRLYRPVGIKWSSLRILSRFLFRVTFLLFFMGGILYITLRTSISGSLYEYYMNKKTIRMYHKMNLFLHYYYYRHHRQIVNSN